MMRLSIILAVISILACFSDAAKPLANCKNGCKMDDECTKEATCSLLNGGECGFCTCNAGFQIAGAQCKPIKGYSTTTTSTTTQSTTTEFTTTSAPLVTDTSTTTQATTSASTASTTTGTTAQPSTPPNPDPLSCADFNCNVNLNLQTTDDNPLIVKSSIVTPSSAPSDTSCKRQLSIPSRPCQMKGGGACYGIYCLTVEPGNDYCICPYYKVDRQCAVDKPGHCDKATGTLPAGYTQLQGKRLRNTSNKDNGSIYGRHFAANLQDCIKLCQWSEGACRSVNFGKINGANVCEQLSIAATEKNLLATWLEKADGWTYAQVGQSN